MSTTRPRKDDDLRARILAEVRRTPSPTREQHRVRIWIVAGVGSLAAAAVFFASSRITIGARPIELVAFVAGFGLVAAAILTRLSTGHPGSMLGRPRHVLLAACVVTAPLLALVPLVAAAIWPGPASEMVGTKTHVACAGLTLLQAALPLATLLLPRRATDPLHPAITGAALGMTAGGWAAALAYLRCPHAAALHCVLAHVAPTLVLAALGAALGWIVLRIR